MFPRRKLGFSLRQVKGSGVTLLAFVSGADFCFCPPFFCFACFFLFFLSFLSCSSFFFSLQASTVPNLEVMSAWFEMKGARPCMAYGFADVDLDPPQGKLEGQGCTTHPYL